MAREGRLQTLAALLLSLGMIGCGKIREIKECRAVAHQIASALDQVESLSKTKDAARTLRIAGHYGALAKSLAPHAAGNASLAGAVRDYAALMQATETALKAHAEALQNGNAARVNETRRELERIVKRERAAIARLAAECRV